MKAAVLIVLVALCSEIYGHSYLTNPKPRSQYTACRIGGPPEFPLNCPGPCEANYNANQQITTVQRGQAFTVQWPRNNHAGGFIRLSFVSAGTPETHTNFDANAQLYACHEVSCHADSGAGDDGGDSNGADGTVNPCVMPITIPTHLTDGRWTMQWSWYGGGGGYLGDYYSCANLNVQGGAAVTARQDPTFVGGDVSNPNRADICEFWQTNKLHYCVSEPCGDICNPNTAPIGHCGWPAGNGRPYMEQIASKVTSTQTGTCRTYTSTDAKSVARQAITQSSVLNVPDAFTVGSITINNIRGSADWIGMFDLYLETPSGSRIMVWNRKDCGTGANFQFSISEAANSVVWPCPPANGGTYKPIDSFGWFIGSQAQGNWKLVYDVKDDCCNGNIQSWGLTLCQVAGANPPPATTGEVIVAQTTTTTTTTTTGDDNTPVINVKVTVSLPAAPATIDISTFIYEITDVLDLPLNAISQILVDLDRSTNTLTIIQFILTNVLKNDGTRVDPVASANALRDLAASNDRKLQNSLMLKGLEFVDSEVNSGSSEDGFSLTYIIIAAVGGAVVLIAIAIIVAAVIVKKRR